MGVLDNTSVTVDAILTKKGREKLAKGEGQFLITKFALGDDEIDYNLYDVSHPNGSNFYGEAIENMNLLEAVPNQNLSLRYKLTDVVGGSSEEGVYTLNLSPSNVSLYLESPSTTITPNLVGWTGATNYSVSVGGDSKPNTYMSWNIDATTGILSVNRTSAPSVNKSYTFRIEEENSGTDSNVKVKVFTDELVPQ